MQITLVYCDKMNSVQMALSSGRNGSGRNGSGRNGSGRNGNRKHDVYTIEVTSFYSFYWGMAHGPGP